MLGPNQTPPFHHRGQTGQALMRELRETFHKRFDIPADRDILFISGSGALALEACCASLERCIYPMYAEAKFGAALSAYLMRYGKVGHKPIGCAYVDYETSTSQRNPIPDKPAVLVDCVSSFPYYPAPDADVWVTVSGKQLGGQPGLGIAVVKKAAWGKTIINDRPAHSYLSLARYRMFAEINQTPNTPALGVMEDLLHSLHTIDLDHQRTSIDSRWQYLCSRFGTPAGQSPPVYTFAAHVPGLDDLELYGNDRTQLFLYSGTDLEFDHVVDRLIRLRNRMGATPKWWWNE